MTFTMIYQTCLEKTLEPFYYGPPYIISYYPNPPTDVILAVDCLDDKREDYQNCSVMYCVLQAHTYEQFFRCISYCGLL